MDFDKTLKELLPSTLSGGYTGNLYSDGTDDRHWSLFPPAITGVRSGHYGYGTSIGSYATKNKEQLIADVKSGDVMEHFNRMIKCKEWELK